MNLNWNYPNLLFCKVILTAHCWRQCGPRVLLATGSPCENFRWCHCPQAGSACGAARDTVSRPFRARCRLFPAAELLAIFSTECYTTSPHQTFRSVQLFELLLLFVHKNFKDGFAPCWWVRTGWPPSPTARCRCTRQARSCGRCRSRAPPFPHAS